MAAKHRYKRQEVVDALVQANGFVSRAAKILVCDQRTVRNYIKKHVECQRAISDAREAMKDFTENALYKKIEAGDTTGIIFYLKTQARDRGYVEKRDDDDSLDERIMNALQRQARINELLTKRNGHEVEV